MERNQLIGTVLLVVLITVYFQFFTPSAEEIVEQNKQEQVDQTVQSSNEIIKKGTPTTELDSVARLAYGVFSTGLDGAEESVTLENEKLIIDFSSKGGAVKKVTLKEFKDQHQQPLVLLDENSSELEWSFISSNKQIGLNDLFFESSKSSADGSQKLVFTLRLDDQGKTITQEYTLAPSGYELQYAVRFNGLEAFVPEQTIQLNWRNDIRKVESDLVDSRNKTTIGYGLANGDTDELSPTSKDAQEEKISEAISWISFKQKFFNSGLIAIGGFENAKISTSINTADSLVVKHGNASLSLSSSTLHKGAEYKFFFGPNDYHELADVADGYSSNINLGWFLITPINKFFILPIFEFLEGFIPSYGVIIILMVIIIRLLLAPLTFKSQVSMAKMKVLKPEMDEINEEFGDDMQKKQSATMKLYQSMGINPLSGCIPMLLQMPILFSMFYFFPSSIKLRQESWLWAEDLSTYDSILSLPFSIPFYGDHVSLFTLLMTASTILSIWSNSQMSAQVQGPMKTMQYVMPITFLFFLNGYSSGLTFYYFVSNVVSYGQTFLFKKFVDEQKIRKKLEENKKKNQGKKKGKFAQRLEEAMKASQETQRNKKR